MFRTRLLRKAYRPDKRTATCPTDVYVCEQEFVALLNTAVRREPMDREQWHAMCSEFSDRWEHVCHWVHPSRMAEDMTAESGIQWTGEFPPKLDAAALRLKVKSTVKAQRFLCPECSIVCNSYAQYTIHALGSKHHDAVRSLQQKRSRQRQRYRSQGAIALDSEGQVSVHESSVPQAYFIRDTLDTSRASTSSAEIDAVEGAPPLILEDHSSDAESTPAPSDQTSPVLAAAAAPRSEAVPWPMQDTLDVLERAVRSEGCMLHSVMADVLDGHAAADVHLSGALLRIVGTPGEDGTVLDATAAAVAAAHDDRLTQKLHRSLDARVGAGPQLVEVEDTMCEQETDHIEERNARELLAYTATFAWSLRLFVSGLLTAEQLSSLLAAYVRNVPSSRLITPPACAVLTQGFRHLFDHLRGLPKGSPQLSIRVPQLPRHTVAPTVRHLLAALDAAASA